MARIKVIVADSEPLFSEALALALGDYRELDILPVRPKSGMEMVRAAIEMSPDVVLGEYWMRGMQGPAATTAIQAVSRGTRVILLVWLYGSREIAYAFAAGAAGLMPKSVGLDEISQAIVRVADGEKRVCPEQIDRIARDLPEKHVEAAKMWRKLRSLTFRELQIMNLLGSGRGLKEITLSLAIQPSTAQTHIHRILEKTGTANRHEAAALARGYGLSPP